METRSNKFLVLLVTGVLLSTLLIFTLWLFDARDGDGNPYMIRFTGSVAGLENGSSVTFSGVRPVMSRRYGSTRRIRQRFSSPSTLTHGSPSSQA